MPEHSFGWRPDTPDLRDHLFASPYLGTQPLPPKVDLRDGFMPAVEDQGGWRGQGYSYASEARGSSSTSTSRSHWWAKGGSFSRIAA